MFFYEKILQAQKTQKAQKSEVVNKRISDFFPLRCFFMRIKMLPFLFLFAYVRFVRFVLFVLAKPFRKKKKKKV